LLTWYYAIPSSSSHTLIGAMAGATIAGAGMDAVNFAGFGKIIIILLLSPIIAFTAGYLMMTIIKYLVLWTGNASRTKMNRVFRFFQIISAGLVSFSHGGNDAQKAMGIIVFALVAGGYQTSLDVPIWVKVLAATAIGLGTSIGGWKIIKTVSSKIIKIEPINGFASDLTSFVVIQTSTFLNMPLSTTHVITSAIIGTGSVIRFHEVKWETVIRMVITWLITIPISMLIGFLIYKVMFLWV